jgi:hypothetical protein
MPLEPPIECECCLWSLSITKSTSGDYGLARGEGNARTFIFGKKASELQRPKKKKLTVPRFTSEAEDSTKVAPAEPAGAGLGHGTPYPGGVHGYPSTSSSPREDASGHASLGSHGYWHGARWHKRESASKPAWQCHSDEPQGKKNLALP